VHGIEVYFVGVGLKGSVLERFPNIKKKKKKKKKRKKKKRAHTCHMLIFLLDLAPLTNEGDSLHLYGSWKGSSVTNGSLAR
jgi:hypothetical protein